MTLQNRTILARQILDEIFYINIATADKDGNPWCTPVYAAFNDKYEFFWASGFETQHSQNIRTTGKAFVTVYDSTLPVGKGEAVYMEGTAEELTPERWQDGLQCLRTRCDMAEKYYPESQYQKNGPVKIYVFRPSKFYMLSPEGDPRYEDYADCRQEIDIFS